MSGCVIALIVVGVVGLLAIGGVVIGAIMVRDAVEEATEVKPVAPGDENFTLVVTKPPHKVGGNWQMTMEGIDITRPDTGAAQ